MSHLICLVPVAPLRKDPSHSSEMISQLLFGELCEMIMSDRDFVKVKMVFDNYEGWCQSAQMHEIDYNQALPVQLAGEWVNTIAINGQRACIPFGSSLSFMIGNRAEVGNYYIEYSGAVLQPQAQLFSAENLHQTALRFLNTSYLWGGRSVFGLDCSGFTQMVYKCFHIFLDRDAYQQAAQGEAIGFLQEATTGDLAFFDNAEGRITHVGILLDSSTIIHASGKVRIDTIDNEGIINTDTGKRTHKLRIIKRVQNLNG